MTAIKLYRFITKNNIEWHYNDNEGTNDVIIFLRHYDIEEFQALLSDSICDDGGIECRMLLGGYFAFWMRDICEYHGVELEEVFIKEEEQ